MLRLRGGNVAAVPTRVGRRITSAVGAAVLAFFVALSGTIWAPTAAWAGVPAQSVGIRLVDAPTKLSNDPHAHQYIIDQVSQGTTISRQVEISNTTTKTQVVQLYAAAATIGGGASNLAPDMRPTISPAGRPPIPLL